MMDATHELHVIRDATRGGVGTVLYEIAGQSQVGIRLDASKIRLHRRYEAYVECLDWSRSILHVKDGL